MPGKKKKKVKERDPNQFTEVDRTFYELQITDLNRKLARLRGLTAELETKNAELLESNTKLDEDRADIIAYLKRTLQERIDEISELQQRLTTLHQTRNDETEQFKQKIFDMEQEYNQMQEQLTSEIKLLNGKLNALEEFRLQRDELMRKYEEQENALEEQEIRHKREIYSIERKFIIGKDKLKKEMETRLLQLSTEFQDVTDVRVAATTHRVIRENIAINNELNIMLETQKRLQTENEKLKFRDKNLRLQAELFDSEKKKAIYKVKTQLNIIENLTGEHANMSKQLENCKELMLKSQQSKKELEEMHHKVASLDYKTRLLDQNLHHSRCERAKLDNNLEITKDELRYVKSSLLEGVYLIKRALRVDRSVCRYEGEEYEVDIDKDTLIDKLYTLLTQASAYRMRKDSQDSIKSCSDIYEKGDLGFVPKKVELRSKLPVWRNVELQMGASFEDFLVQQETIFVEDTEIEESEETSEEGSQQEAAEEEDEKVFFSANTSEDQSDDSGEKAGAEVEAVSSLHSKKSNLEQIASSTLAKTHSETNKTDSQEEI